MAPRRRRGRLELLLAVAVARYAATVASATGPGATSAADPASSAVGQLPTEAAQPGDAPSWTSLLDHGQFHGFPSYEEANKLLSRWLLDFPSLIRQQVIGKSYEKRPIHAYVLASGSRPRPQMLVTALMHAREPAGLTVALYFVGHLLESYAAGDPEATYLLEDRELWVVPFVNPDGYVANQHLQSTAPMIRKNLRKTCGSQVDSGVDINRNFAIAWQKNAFPPCNEEYGGTAPFSEPETLALKHLCDTHVFKAAINFHSFGSMLTHPFNHAKTKALAVLPIADDNAIYAEIQRFFKFDKFGPAIATVGYTAIGESDDWMYGAKGIIAMSPEVGPEYGGFYPPVSSVPGIDTRNYARIAFLARMSGIALSFTWNHIPDLGGHYPSPVADALKGRQSSHHVLRLDIQNSGLSASAGTYLSIAVAGLGFSPSSDSSEAASTDSLVVVSDRGEPLPTELVDGIGGPDGAPAVTFLLHALPRRSHTSVWVSLPDRPGPANGAGASVIHTCALEPGSRVCQCDGLVPVPSVDDSSQERPFELVVSGTEDVGTGVSLCTAAARPVTAPFEWTAAQGGHGGDDDGGPPSAVLLGVLGFLIPTTSALAFITWRRLKRTTEHTEPAAGDEERVLAMTAPPTSNEEDVAMDEDVLASGPCV